MIKVTDNVFWVGALNPNLRIFDIIMKTAYGTSYNSYLVRGEKIALIDACHERFFDDYIGHIKEITPLDKIDYLIINHCEPDHTGALKQLINLIPNVKIFTTPAGNINLKFITNNEHLNITVVKDHEILDLGNEKKLEFIFAPFLHWPDTMFTYLKSEGIVFTCDFLGSHYCEPQMFDNRITYLKAYLQSVREYYDAIFGPFTQYVQKGLEILKNLEFKYICNSHGPILTKGVQYETVYKTYDISSQTVIKPLTIPIFYASAYGYTAKAALSIQKGIKSVDSNIVSELYDVNNYSREELAVVLNKADAFCLGGPTINKNAVPPILDLLSSIDTINSIGKCVFIFGSYGWSGESSAVIANYAQALKLKVFDQIEKFRFSPDDKALSDIETTAKSFVAFIKNK